MPRPPPRSPFQAYEGTQRSAQPRRQAEALAFTRAAAELEAASRSPVDRRCLDEALKKNSVLWTVVRAECAAPGNRLPSPLKANMIALADAVERLTARALATAAPTDVAPLVEIDREIAQGLLDGLPRKQHR